MEKSATSARYYPVKMCMEISYTTHSHIIGRGGANINHVMQETSTKIHFPDQNRVTGEKKSNEVTISGDLANVDNARRRLRFLTPVEYVVECPTKILDVYGRAGLAKNFATNYDVLLRLNEKPSNPSPTTAVTLRGSHQDVARLKEAVMYFLRISQQQVHQVASKMEVASEYINIIETHGPSIETQYSVVITCSSPGFPQQDDNRTVWIRGSIDTVYMAKNALTELLPLKLMFHVHSVHLAFGVNERKLARRLDVAVKMESSTKPNSFLLQISSYEKNAGNIYEFRRQILRLPNGNTNNFTHPCPPRLQDSSDHHFMTNFTKPHSPRFREVVDSVSTSSNSPPRGDNCSSSSLAIVPSVNQLSSISGTLGSSVFSLKFDKLAYVRLCELLIEANLAEYCEIFLCNEVDLSMFMTLGDEDLKNIGVSSYRARRIMLQMISDLRSKAVAKGLGFLNDVQERM